MYTYMVEIEFPDAMAEEFIRKQKPMIEGWMAEGIVKSCSLSKNQSKQWIVMAATSEFGVLDIIDQMPFSEYILSCIAQLETHGMVALSERPRAMSIH